MENQEPDENQTPSLSAAKLAPTSVSEISRRRLLRRLGIGAVAASAMGAAEGSGLSLLPGRRNSCGAAWAQAAATSPPVDGGAKQQFPYYTDGPWDQPKYYETIHTGRRRFPKTQQSGDIDGDGRDEMIARGPGGIHVNRFDHSTGQWAPMPDGPPLTDTAGYDQERFYSTIQLADINGDNRAELVGNGPDGVYAYRYDLDTQKWVLLAAGPKWSEESNGENFDLPQFYWTIQLADIDGDGRAELIGRNSDVIEVWKYESNNSWTRMPNGPPWSNSNSWDQPQYYQTIQCANLGRGTPGQMSLVGRNRRNIEVWNYDSDNSRWTNDLDGPALSDADGWNEEGAYQTIQFGSLSGGDQVLIGRDNSGIRAWVFSSVLLRWLELPHGPAWARQNGLNGRDDGWNHAEYYQTIQLADIDGDGKEELLGRASDGLNVWKFDVDKNAWSQMSTLNAWSDANGWDKVQHYLTINTARVLKPGDIGYTGDGTHTQAVVIGRGPLGIQTFRWVNAQVGWIQTSATAPDFTSNDANAGLRAAYTALNRKLNAYPAVPGNSGIGEIRGSYNNAQIVTGADNTIRSAVRNLYSTDSPPASYELQPRPSCQEPPPTGVSQADWDTVTWQIYWEFRWVEAVASWYGETETGSLLVSEFIGETGVLSEIRSAMEVSNSDGTSILLTFLALVSSMAAAVLTGGASLGVEAAALGVAAAVAGGLSSICSTIPGFLSNGNTVDSTIASLEDALKSGFSQAQDNSTRYQFALTGGYDPDDNYSYKFPDYGRLKMIGQLLDSGTWRWDTGSKLGAKGRLFSHAVRGYAKYAWQTVVFPIRFHDFYDPDYTHDGRYDKTFPKRYQYDDGANILYLTLNLEFVAPVTLAKLFDPITDAPFPLGVPLEDVYEGHNGWGGPKSYDEAGPNGGNVPAYDDSLVGPVSGSIGGPEPRSALPALGVDITQTVTLSRDPVTQNVLVTVTLENKGLTPATNVEITEARLNMRGVNTIHQTRQKRLTYGHFETITLTFPALTGRNAVLSIRGEYQGGTFGASFRLPMP